MNPSSPDTPEPQFISEPITPAPGSFDPRVMARGEPGLPTHFTWRKQAYNIAEILETWTTSGQSLCGETYLRRHWYKVRTDRGAILTVSAFEEGVCEPMDG